MEGLPGGARSRAPPAEPGRARQASIPFTRPLALAKSIRPAYFPFRAAMTLPMSFGEAAPVSAMAAWIAARVSSSSICWGRKLGDDRGLGALSFRELGPAALVVDRGGFVALLDHLLEQGEDLLLGQRLLAEARASMSLSLRAAWISRTVASFALSPAFMASSFRR